MTKLIETAALSALAMSLGPTPSIFDTPFPRQPRPFSELSDKEKQERITANKIKAKKKKLRKVQRHSRKQNRKK